MSDISRKEKEVIFENLLILAKEIEANFYDLKQRKFLLLKLKEELNRLWKSSIDDIRRIALRLESAVNIIMMRPKELTREQAKTLVKVFEVLKSKEEKSKKEIGMLLKNARLHTLPEMKGLTELYKKNGLI